MPFKPEDFEPFTAPDFSVVQAWGKKLNQYLHNVVVALGIENRSDIKIHRDTLYEIFNRIEKRRVYFYIYHNKMKMGEINEGALLCFWILKLMPFYAKDNNIPASLLNTKIAYIVFVNLLHYVANKTRKKVNVKAMLMNNLLYAFQYRDLSKESIMALAESHLY